MSEQKITRDALAAGDMVTWITGLEPDEIHQVELPLGGGALVLFARIGRTQIGLRQGGGQPEDVTIHVHEDVDGARECYAWNRDRLARVADAAATGDPLTLLLAMAEAAGITDDQDMAAVPVSSVPGQQPGYTRDVSYVDAPTGLYL